MTEQLNDARCPARDLNGFLCTLELDHPGGHSASRVLSAWVDETTLEAETVPLENAAQIPPTDIDYGRRLAALSDDDRRAWDEWVREHPSLNEIQLAWQLEPWLHRRRVGPQTGARHIVALAIGVLSLLVVYLLSLGPDPSGPAERSVYAMTVGPIVLVAMAVAAFVGLYGLAGVVRYQVRDRPEAGLLVSIAVIGWLVASCVVPLVV